MGNIPELLAGTDAVLPRGESHPSQEHTACPAPTAPGMQSPGDRQWVSTDPPGHVPPAARQGDKVFHDNPCSYTLLPDKNNPHLPFWLHGHWTFTFIPQHLRSANPSQGDIFWVVVSQDPNEASSPFVRTFTFHYFRTFCLQRSRAP